MTQSIMSFYSENVWSKDHSRNTQRTLHWVLQAVGSSAALAGMSFEFTYAWKHDLEHFTSTHSIIGLTAGILTIIGMLNGISALWSVELRKLVRPVYVKLAHNLTGISAFVLGECIVSTLIYFLDHHFQKK